MQQNALVLLQEFDDQESSGRLMPLNLSKSSWKGMMEAVEEVKKRLSPEMN